jgi:hypothetical protein
MSNYIKYRRPINSHFLFQKVIAGWRRYCDSLFLGAENLCYGHTVSDLNPPAVELTFMERPPRPFANFGWH